MYVISENEFILASALFVTLVSFLGFVLYGWFSQLAAWRSERVAKESFFKKLDYNPESFRSDSPYFNSAQPSSQFSVWSVDDDTRTLLGHGVRLDDYLVVPTHVINSVGAVHIVSCRVDKNGVERRECVAKDELVWRELCFDVSYCALPAKLGAHLQKARVGPVHGKVFCEIATAFDKDNSSGSYLEKAGFGMLEYHGSTRPGFSGAVYKCNGSVVAMHLGGGVQNLAVSLSYVMNLLKHPESSEAAALERILRSANREDWEYAATGDPDQLQVYAGGRYYVIDREEFYQMMESNDYEDVGDEYQDRTGRKRVRKQARVNVEDLYEPEAAQPSTSFLGVPPLGASLKKLDMGPAIDCPAPSTSSSGSSSSAQEVLDGRLQQLMLCVDHLNSTVESMRKREEELLSQLQQKSCISEPSTLQPTAIDRPVPRPRSPKTTRRDLIKSSAPSTSRAQPVEESSHSTQPSATLLGGQDTSVIVSRMLRDCGVQLPDGYKLSLRRKESSKARAPRLNISSSGSRINKRK